MRRFPATITAAVLLVVVVVLFNLFGTPGQDPHALLPLLERRGQWPHRHLMGLEPDRRAWVLGQVVASAGHACDPREVEFKGVREDGRDPIAYHYVTCDDGRAYLVALVADERGTTHVLDCRKTYQRGLDCVRDWARLPLPPP